MADTVEERAKAIFERSRHAVTWAEALRLPPFDWVLRDCRDEARKQLLAEAQVRP